MRTAYLFGMTLILAANLGSQNRCQAQQPPPPPPHTLWHFLGIPQAVHRSYDHHANRTGQHPSLERKPPLKALADPANLLSDNPAIKAAADIKQQEDLKPQKIKAIRYLAAIACGCYPGVKEALLAALDDCTEEVRYEAAVAFCTAAGNPCSLCNRATCCDQTVKDKLRDMAFGTDANGCYKEPSARVRAAAQMALNACNQIPSLAPAERKELPVEGRETGEDVLRGLEAPLPPIPAPPNPPPAPAASKSASPISQVSLASGALEEPWSPETQTGGIEPARLGSAAVQHSGARGIGCPCPRYQGRSAWPVRPGTPGAPGAAAQAPLPSPSDEGLGVGPDAPALPPSSALAGSFGAARAPASAAPTMIGDFFGGGYSYMTFGGQAATVSTAGADRNFKIVESNSPLPADRVFFNYHHFSNALETFEGRMLPLDRYTFGVEKTFWDENWSAEFRIPFARGLDSEMVVGQGAGLSGTEFGNLAMAVKAVLHRGQCSALSAGLGIVFPTGSDSELFFDDGDGSLVSLASVENEAVHLQPFLGYLWTPSDRLFVQFFSQLDFDANGNRTLIRGVEGRLQDQSLLFLDTSIGYWAYRNPCARFLKGIAPVVELHYSTTLQSPDAAPAGPVDSTPSSFEIATITNPAFRQDILNLTGGIHFQLFQSTILTVAGAAPLRSGSDRQFDAEFTLQLNHYF